MSLLKLDTTRTLDDQTQLDVYSPIENPSSQVQTLNLLGINEAVDKRARWSLVRKKDGFLCFILCSDKLIEPRQEFKGLLKMQKETVEIEEPHKILCGRLAQETGNVCVEREDLVCFGDEVSYILRVKPQEKSPTLVVADGKRLVESIQKELTLKGLALDALIFVWEKTRYDYFSIVKFRKLGNPQKKGISLRDSMSRTPKKTSKRLKRDIIKLSLATLGTLLGTYAIVSTSLNYV